MATNKRITDLTDYKSILPYASEIYGVYQPLIGWKSKRIQNRLLHPFITRERLSIDSILKHFDGIAELKFNADCHTELEKLEPGQFATPKALMQSSIILQEIASVLKDRPVPKPDEWGSIIHADTLRNTLLSNVFPTWEKKALEFCKETRNLPLGEGETEESHSNMIKRLITANQEQIKEELKRESAIAGVLLTLVDSAKSDILNKIFYNNLKIESKEAFLQTIDDLDDNFKDPYLTFDPNGDIKDVTLSPLGIVHLYRQYFFELDTFLGTPVGHVWIAPGSTVELIEVNTRKTITEKTYETSIESITKTETSTTDQEEISQAVKQDNKDDLKLGVTTTVNQSWGTGNASATASLNMDKTQQVARENTQKKMREQSQKLSSEIRENFKSTLKTVTEITDTSSKRYVLSNSTPDLINYELRRKMRQVGVQVQDIGTYLCWETFVDEPGEQLGLANLVHIAKPADLIPEPVISETPAPPDKSQTFTTNLVWDFGDTPKKGSDYPGLEFVLCTTYQVPPAPDGYELKKADFSNGFINIHYVSHSGEDSENQIYAFRGKFSADFQQIQIGVLTEPDGIEWDKRIDFVVGGTLTYTPTAMSLAAIKDANDKRKAASATIQTENIKKQNEAYINAAKERIELASNIKKRKYEDLREEERIIVYRNLIEDLMTEQHYLHISNQSRHVLSELINSIFDIDKMLYFVAPEWWKPRKKGKQFIGTNEFQQINADSLVTWSNNVSRKDNYLITDKSQPAPMGSSLGWLIQLDADNLRNAFLNAPWVKAVIPVRPGKEQAAINWLQNVNVEGSDGLEATYAASNDELNNIRTKLLEKDPNDPVIDHVQVTISDAIRKLCLDVAEKDEASKKVDKYPKEETDDDNKVLATPIEKVYEHGFYPLQGGFKAVVEEYFETISQWIEVLPTDQIVPVEVKYDPKTGRQL
jgi:hypothetical protein